MSSCVLHRCSACGFEIEAWSDGFPYIRNDMGNPRFYFHPCEMEQRREILASCEWARDRNPDELERLLERKSGVMSEMLCLDCGWLFKVDLTKRRARCRKCKSENAKDVVMLGGETCPKCGKGRFPEEPLFHAIS